MLNRGSLTAGTFSSAATFQSFFWHKASFVLLNQVDLLLTLLGISLGAHELNPFMRVLLASPLQMILFKIAIPYAIAWLVPGRLLLPAIGLLAFIAGWDIKELVIFFLA